MTSGKMFFAYPYQPAEIAATIKSAIAGLKTQGHDATGWETTDIAGRFIADEIFHEIDSSKVLVADITRLNFNVSYEIGYAIGKGARILLTRNSAFLGEDQTFKELGIFDTIGHSTYKTSDELVSLVASCRDLRPHQFEPEDISRQSPVFVVLPRHKTDPEVRILSRLRNKARLGVRTYDPEEQGRLSGPATILNVAQSIGVVVPLLPRSRGESEIHNIRAAFTAGLTAGMGKDLLLMQGGEDPVPLDYRDLVKAWKNDQQIDGIIADFAPHISAGLQSLRPPTPTRGQPTAITVKLGASSAENEIEDLEHYYLETDEFHRALRGEVQVVAGRKGSGKTALFVQLRNKVSANRRTVVIDLMPEGYQLLKFKADILDLLEEGTREHTIAAFWEYVLLLEICARIIEQDKEVHSRDSRLLEPYRTLSQIYQSEIFGHESDFSDRLSGLTKRLRDSITQNSDDLPGAPSSGSTRLSAETITNVLHVHDIAKLRVEIENYLKFNDGLWLIFDNLDKGWPASGLKSGDLLIIRALLDAMSKLTRSLQRHRVSGRGIIFIRNDVLELLIKETPDRGKLQKITLDWTNPQLLRELIRRRLAYHLTTDESFDEIWRQFCVSHINGEETSQYLIDRSLMRPRALIDFMQTCQGHAVNLGHDTITEDDIIAAEQIYSRETLQNISLEMGDIFPPAEEALYSLVGSTAQLSEAELVDKLRVFELLPDQITRAIELFIWFGVIGLFENIDTVTYIHSVGYDTKKLKAILRTAKAKTYAINPAFWASLGFKK